MKLQEVDWNAPGGAATIEVDYPDALVQDLVNWLRRSSAWKENPELVERRMVKFNRDLAEHRNAVATGAKVGGQESAWSQRLRSDPKLRDEVERGLRTVRAEEAKAHRVAGLAKARSAKRAKAARAVS